MDALLVLYVVSGLLLAVLSVPLILRRVPPNGMYGFRVPQTLSDPDVWYDANAFAGRYLLLTGVATVLAAILLCGLSGISLDAYALANAAIVVGLLAVTLIQCWRYLKKRGGE